MGFKSLIENQVQGAMRILGTDDDGLARKHDYMSVDPSQNTYDYATREVSGDVTRIRDVPMVMVRFKIEDMDTEVKPKSDRRALIAAKDLPIVASEKDYLFDPDGTRWNVVRLLSDPAAALLILHLRRS